MENHVLPYFKQYSESIHRISAIRHSNGGKGCAMSHSKALTFALDNTFEHTLIFEDDATINGTDRQSMIDTCMKSFEEIKSVYDVFVLGSVSGERVMIPHPDPQSLISTLVLSGGSHAYIIHKSYIPTLKAIYTYSVKHLSDHHNRKNYHLFAMDQLHKQLQMDHRWYIPKQNTILQLESYSDIDHTNVKHIGIKQTNKIPYCVFTFWIGGPPMSNQRENAFIHMHKDLDVPIIHITEHNLAKYTLWPIHPAVQYLSGIHKADYFRIYFMLHIGGGYYDIKHPTEPWSKYFYMFEDPNVWMIGVPEEKIGMAKSPIVEYDEDNYKRCITNSWFISRRNNPIMKEIHDMQNKILDKHMEKLKTNPPPSERCCFNHENGYPLRWAEILGELTSQVVPTYFDNHVKAIIKKPSVRDYL